MSNDWVFRPDYPALGWGDGALAPRSRWVAVFLTYAWLMIDSAVSSIRIHAYEPAIVAAGGLIVTAWLTGIFEETRFFSTFGERLKAELKWLHRRQLYLSVMGGLIGSFLIWLAFGAVYGACAAHFRSSRDDMGFVVSLILAALLFGGFQLTDGGASMRRIVRNLIFAPARND